MKSLYDVSIIIVNYNTRDLILQCLNSIFEKTKGMSFEVIVVDNASTDDSVYIIEQEYPQVILIKSQENLGFGRANNLGYENSSGEYIFLLNSDTFLINNSIKILWEFLNIHKEVSIVGGQLYEENGINKTHSYSFLFPSIKMELDLLLRGYITRRIKMKRLDYFERNGFMPVSYITGADMMLRRIDIQKYGFFNPEFFLYFEETELSYRYRRNGLISVFYPTAKIIHLGGGSFSLVKVRSKFYKEGRKKYFKLVHSTLHYYIANTIRSLFYFTVTIRKMMRS